MNPIVRINSSWSPKKLDAFLNHNLLNYAHFLAEVLIESFWGSPRFGITKKSFKSELDTIKRLKEKTMKNFLEYFRDYAVSSNYENLKYKKEKEEFVINILELKRAFTFLDQRKYFLEQFIDFSNEKTRGRPLSKKYKIASIWAWDLKRNGKIPLSNIIELLKWFYVRLKNTSYGKELKIPKRRTRKRRKNQRESFKDQCLSIKGNNLKISVLSSRIFSIRTSQEDKNPYLHSIKFSKESIEINKMFKNDRKIWKIKMEFIDGKKFVSFYKLEPSADKEKPFIIFPNGEIFYKSVA